MDVFDEKVIGPTEDMFIAFFKEFYLLDGGYFPLKKVKPRCNTSKSSNGKNISSWYSPLLREMKVKVSVAVPEHLFCYKLSQYSK